ncbi:MAG: DUF4328 domain-containing protein [Gemmatimonadota bacterium]|nr:DUF4328 domain-containing protein [Gemmatimonadota bacterium]
MSNDSATPGPQKGFRDPVGLTRWVRGLLCAYVALNLVWIWMHARAYQELVGGGTVLPLPLRVGLPFVGLIGLILIFVWVYRAHHNAEQLGATGLKFSPGWSVGCYFVPVVWFWKPYQAMKEVWQASASPSGWTRQPGSVLLKCWWMCWLLAFFAEQAVSLAVGTSGVMPDPGAVEVGADLATNAVEVPLTLLLLVIIGRVNRMQMEQYRKQVAAGRIRVREGGGTMRSGSRAAPTADLTLSPPR